MSFRLKSGDLICSPNVVRHHEISSEIRRSHTPPNILRHLQLKFFDSFDVGLHILLPFIMAASGSKSTARKRGGHKRIMTAAKREEANETETAPATVSAASEPTDSDPKQLAVKAEPNPSGGPIRVKSITGMTAENFREVALTILSEEMRSWQGPARYLRARFATPEDQAKFKEDLDSHFEARPDLVYCQGPTLPDNTSTKVKLRLSDLGFRRQAPRAPLCLRPVSSSWMSS